ncbi:DsbA family protein [Corynebacterium sp. 335C]
MSQKKIKNPNEKSSGFVVGIIALVAIIAVVIGVVLWMGRNQPIEGLPDEDVAFGIEVEDDVIRLAAEGADGTVAEVYEDYSCHYCADMALGGHSDQLAALNAGDLIVEYRTLNFLDGGREGHSTRALAVMNRIAETGDARLYWNFHTLLMDQQQKAAGWEWEDFASHLESMGAEGDVVDEVRGGLPLDGAKAVGDASATRLMETLNQDSPSSPHVIVDGKDVLQNAASLGDWVKAAVGA